MATPSHAVFLSYASEDAAAAERIAHALRSAGIEVWLDQSELRGGEAWDRNIRREIHDCALFIPLISANAHARDEGYFRLEWKLATDRSHLMAPDKTFLLPVVIDNTPQTDERIPDRFREVHWSPAPGGQVSPAFVDRVQRLLAPVQPDVRATARQATHPVSATTPASGRSVGASWRLRRLLWVMATLVALGASAYFALDRLPLSKHPAPPPAAVPGSSATPAAFSPPPHSIAVLPFVNMSGDKSQEYFSDGLTEEVLNSLARINELQVAARTSAFSFKGKDTDIGTIARKLNVGAILEGSVRRSGHTVRITVQLNNAVTGFHLWSEAYDKNLGDVLKLQTEIANAVANVLKIKLLGDVAGKVEAGGTRNPAAFDAYLRASEAHWGQQSQKDLQSAISGYTEALRLDPDYGLAYADRSLAFSKFADDYATGQAVRDSRDKAQTDARKAIGLAPALAEAHLALAHIYEGNLEFTLALEEYERALALEPGNARVLSSYGSFALNMGQTEAGLAAVYRAVALDPLNYHSQYALGSSLIGIRNSEAIAAFTKAKALAPNDMFVIAWLGFAHIANGDLEAARTTCEGIKIAEDFNRLFCLADVYDKLGRHADADTSLAHLRALGGEEAAVFYAMLYADRGDRAQALDWLETAMRHRDPYLIYVKANGMFDSLRTEPRFQAIERALKFPE